MKPLLLCPSSNWGGHISTFSGNMTLVFLRYKKNNIKNIGYKNVTFDHLYDFQTWHCSHRPKNQQHIDEFRWTYCEIFSVIMILGQHQKRCRIPI